MNEVPVLQLMFEQMPPVYRAIFGLFSFGLFTLATYIWNSHRRRIQKAEERIEAIENRERGYVTSDDLIASLGQLGERLDQGFRDTRKDIRDTHKRIDQYLASTTRGQPHD